MAAVQERGGVLTLEDLSAHRCEHRDPLMSTYRGYHIYEVAPPTAVSLWSPMDPFGFFWGSLVGNYRYQVYMVVWVIRWMTSVAASVLL